MTLLFDVSFADGSYFILPEVWKEVFADYYGSDSAAYPLLAEQLRFVVGKYIEHRAWPSKFDGIGLEDEEDSPNRYDNPDFYWEHWGEWGEDGRLWGDGPISVPPTSAEVAEAVLYQSMRVGLMQQVLNQIAKEQGTTPIRVITPEQLLEELEEKGGEDEDAAED